MYPFPGRLAFANRGPFEGLTDYMPPSLSVRRRAMTKAWKILVLALVLGVGCGAHCQDARQIVQQAVATELAANDADHSRWLYFEVDRKPKATVKQWVAETEKGYLCRVVEENERK